MSEFVMGARIILRDMVTQPINNMIRATRNFESGAREAAQATQELSEASGGLKESLMNLPNLLKAAASGAALMGAKRWLIDSNADMETYKNTLTVVLKSQEKAVEALDWATKFAAQTPFEIPQIVEATVRMESYGLSAKENLGMIGDMASVMGKDVMDAVEAVADAQTGETERLKEFGITKDMIATKGSAMGKDILNSKGQITDQKAFNAALFAIMKERYAGGMALQSTTFKGMLSNASDFISSVGRALGKPIFDVFKKGLNSALIWLNELQNSGAIDRWANDITYLMVLAGDAFTKFKKTAEGPIQYIMYRANLLYTHNKPLFDTLKILLGSLFTGLKTNGGATLNWLIYNVIPKAIKLLFDMAQKVLDVANYFKDNWSWIGPFVEGIAWSLGIYLTYLGLVKAMTITATAMQWLWNAAMTANPIGLVIVGIGLLIGAGILLYNNWDTLKEKANDVWVSVENVFKSGVNGVIEQINSLISAISSITGVEVPLIAKLEMSKTSKEMVSGKWGAMNDAYAKQYGYSSAKDEGIDGSHANGLSYVPFDGYISELHKGEMVLTAREALRMRRGIGIAGAPGVSGIAGVPGVSGIAGAPGVSGIAGVPGVSGIAGAPGVSGIAGVPGVSGIAGAPGVSGIAGVPGISGIAGAPENGRNTGDLSYVPYDGYATERPKEDYASENSRLSTPAAKSKSNTISKLADKIEITITGAAEKDPKSMVMEIVNQLYAVLSGADDIAGNASMEALL